MRINVDESFWRDDLDNWFVSLHDEWDEMVVASGKTRSSALRRAERILERALARVKKLREKEEAK